MGVTKAYFEVLEGENKGKQIEASFNPTELSFSKSAQMAEIAIPGLDSPVLQFIRGGAETLTAELFFDTTDDGMAGKTKSVTERTDLFYYLVKQDRETHAPPRCRFSWGSPPPQAGVGELRGEVSYAPFWFVCVVEAVDRRFLLFSPEGVPLRARLSVRMREYKTVEEMAALLHSADHTKARVFQGRERLDQLAAQEYDAPGEWRRIAEANGLEDPRRVPAGTVLKIPPLRVESATRRVRR